MKKYKKISCLSVLVTSILVLSLFQIVHLSHAQPYIESPIIHPSFKFFEYSEIKGTKDNISSINIQLPESNWTVTDIQMNISDISLSSEINIIEDIETGLETVWSRNSMFRTFALGTQLEILELTEIYGVFIKGYKTVEANEIIKFQIQGYDEGNYSPNNTIYRSIDLNISTNLDWYYQDFSSDPITLPIGNYSLVMNGTNLPQNYLAKYYWLKNTLNPQIPHLYTSSYITSWSTGIVNTSFLFKLNQSVERIYNPEDINMTSEFNGETYKIINGPKMGTGVLEIANISHVIGSTNVYIPFQINQTIELNFNYNYTIHLTNEFSTRSSAIIKENYDNEWTLFPIFSRNSPNYFIQFNFPKSWFNLTVYRKLSTEWENITSNTTINWDKRYIVIHNAAIKDGADWKIIAYSPNINFDLVLNDLKWKPGQELKFSVFSSIDEGNFTFDLINPLNYGFEEPIVKEVQSEETFFSYKIPSNSREGLYTIKIYWNNNTDAGIQSQVFNIIIPFTLDPMLIMIILVGIAIISTTGFVSYKLVKRSRSIRKEHQQRIFNKYRDMLNLDYFIISEKESGLTIFDQLYGGKKFDSSLISSFLQAIRIFGIELTDSEEQTQTIKLDYMNLKILMSEFKNFRILLLMKDNPSHDFLDSIKILSYEIEKKFSSAISKFDGDLGPFRGIKELLEEHLETSIKSPLKVIEHQVKTSSDEKSMITRAVSIMKANNTDYFYVLNLLSTKKGFQTKDVEIIHKLIKNKIFLQYVKTNPK